MIYIYFTLQFIDNVSKASMDTNIYLIKILLIIKTD